MLSRRAAGSCLRELAEKRRGDQDGEEVCVRLSPTSRWPDRGGDPYSRKEGGEGRKGKLQLDRSESGAERRGRGRRRGQLTSSLAWNKYSFPSCKLLGEKRNVRAELRTWDGCTRAGEELGYRPRPGWGTRGYSPGRQTRHVLHILQIPRTVQKQTLAVQLPRITVSSSAPQAMPPALAARWQAGASPGRPQRPGSARTLPSDFPSGDRYLACHRQQSGLHLGAPAPLSVEYDQSPPPFPHVHGWPQTPSPITLFPLLLACGSPFLCIAPSSPQPPRPAFPRAPPTPTPA